MAGAVVVGAEVVYAVLSMAVAAVVPVDGNDLFCRARVRRVGKSLARSEVSDVVSG